ncbi:GIN domain-containing protein [Pedobacter sp. SYP-B3415]|uniref:GIN domain-containing protein n=1 Tax=Pedobacter sp. SYP-B3415 TaxID=2496641 RepID=UPI00101CA1E6|nr:DUF2807 domain-containing protein [Pedobacter sp. SYP-B3415]
MKTSIKTLFVAAMSAIICTSGAFAATADAKLLKIEKAAHPKGVRKIVAEGNVEIVLVQGKSESVKNLSEETCRARVTQKGDVLHIVSTQATPERIEVSVKDIYRIQASGSVKVITPRDLNMQFLQIILKDDAKAEVGANVEGLFTMLQDSSSLKLSGTARDHSLNMSSIASITMDKFNSLRSSAYPIQADGQKVAAR